MKHIVRTVQLSLSYLPDPIKHLIRKVIPVNLKIIMGRHVMADAFKKGGIVTVKDGRKFNVIEDSLFLRVYYEKDYEPLFSAVAVGLLEEGDNVADVGANFGWYSTLFSHKITSSGKVYSYEPAPNTYDKLMKNIELNGMSDSIVVKNACAGDVSGTIYFEQGAASESALAHVVSEKNNSSIELPVVTLDSDLESIIGEIAYIKIDVEGYELSTLKGAERILTTPNQPIIQIELNEDALERAGASRQEVIKFLKSKGYSFWEADSKRPGMLKESDVSNCSDVFCFGAGKYGERLKAVAL